MTTAITARDMADRVQRVAVALDLLGVKPPFTIAVGTGWLWSVDPDGEHHAESVDNIVDVQLDPAGFLAAARDASFREWGRKNGDGNAYWSGHLGTVPVLLYTSASALADLLATGDHGVFVFNERKTAVSA